MNKWITALLISLLSFPTFAEQFKNMKDIEVHYVAFNSTFLTPKIARSYDIKRNGYLAIINISVLDRASLGKPALEAKVSGQAKNLIGQTQKLTFREIKEGDAIYYLAELPVTHEETFTFDIDVKSGNKGSGKLKFTQKFFVEE
ncbi:DUF4426 domain-containing protein [Vibrio sp. B1FLJ16]|uniref:DUF4426 domain-containing protein n=1 Tax=Vibrio sp. B1FLJ16 TaxID=2751178 RepID=UPI0015F4CBF2|nr:DUF4426 domain-containing protein [Vibrio sp. B1FLJ16]MCA0934998.1 DUF4426 domain-containing protein [Vibrio alginolyticus]CAD7811669.1 hypothetical protein ACOMICROBIO_FLGHMIGD_02387 [Vibrio sp. B1FLJ16]CAD7812526.1 hypothetical protein ACOMICROBIO_EPCKBFOG_02514 [Vibrio sp. B1FLJ16]CAE6915620.1 hypothetical protein ACOMICROBIO_FLGHMIGD_02387 [Vibrio sp. B1FLJ16]CAE6919063.1 hypothetical protein ACOMICROBIO_EPCKBFOG_02514 [Vibrio sp. B1FLJ16]